MKIAMIGFGNVGRGVYALYNERKYILEKSLGQEIIFAGIAVKNLNKKRDISFDRNLLTDNYNELIERQDIDTILDLTGLVDQAQDFSIKALSKGKNLISANKAALAENFPLLMEAAKKGGGRLRFEAAVGGGIPLIEDLAYQMKIDHIYSIRAIINGSSNYVLSEMSKGKEKEKVLEEASKLGILEADPSADLEGYDSSRKLTILANMYRDAAVYNEDIIRIGMGKIENRDLEYFAKENMRVKLVACLSRKNKVFAKGEDSKDYLGLRVMPQAVPSSDPLYNVSGIMNMVHTEGEHMGPLTFYGPGGRMEPTANAVWSDILRMERSSYNPENYNTSSGLRIDNKHEGLFYVRQVEEQKGHMEKLSFKEAEKLSEDSVLIYRGEK